MLAEPNTAIWVTLPTDRALYRTWPVGWDESGYALVGFPGPRGHDRKMTYPQIAAAGGWIGPLPEPAINHCLHTCYAPDPQDCGGTVAGFMDGIPLCTEHLALWEWAASA